MSIKRGLDNKDILILEALQKDGRITLAELGRTIGLSQPAISERVTRLEESGVITGYCAQVNLKALGLGLVAIIRLSTEHMHIKNCLRKFDVMPNVIEAYRVTGEDCFVLRVVFSDPAELRALVDEIAEFGSVKTSLVLSSEVAKIIGKSLIHAK